MELATFPGKSPLKPPNHLRAAGRRLWVDIVTQYRIGDAAGEALVTTAAECLDRIREITRSAAVTTSLEGDEWAVGMITCERSRRKLRSSTV